MLYKKQKYNQYKTPSFIRFGKSLLVAVLILIATGQKANACGVYCWCVPPPMAVTIALVSSEHDDTRDHITAEFQMHEDFLEYEFWYGFLLPAMMKMTEQISAVALQQMEIIGALFDAKHQLETQRLLQAMEADIRDDYEADDIELCNIATDVRTLASSESYAKMNSLVMSQRSQDRQLGNINSSAVEGEHIDRRNRMILFKERYCDPHDNDGGLYLLCKNTTPVDTVNLDINYTQLIDMPATIDVDLCNLDSVNGDCQPDYKKNVEDTEIDIWSLASNLYAHNIFLRIPDTVLQLPDNQAKYLDVRSIIAKRSVAENSFNIITGMKTKGSPDLKDPNQNFDSSDTAAYMIPLLQEIGYTLNDAKDFMETYPSYYAQMDVLTKKIYQRQEFYTGLYDAPENVKRRSVALKAIDLMQNLDTLKSTLRTEMMLSVLLEMGIMDLQEGVQNKLNPQRGVGVKD